MKRNCSVLVCVLVSALAFSCQQSSVVRKSSSETASADVLPPTSSSAVRPWIYAPKVANEVSFMTFNVENLFDTEQDANRDDYTFLPLSLKQTQAHRDHCNTIKVERFRDECLNKDWNEEFLDAKMKNLSQVILDLDGGIGPDVLLMAEVENIHVLNQLNQKYLQKAHYQTAVLIEGFDERGIDTALLSRFPVKGKPVLHRIPFDASKIPERNSKLNTRGILEVTLVTPNKHDVTVFVGHLPAQGNPTEMRKQATEFLLTLLKTKKNMVIAGGDFNITKSEEQEYGYFKNIINQGYQVSHFYGCPGCEGTHNYQQSWSFLDVLIFPKNLSTYGFTASPDRIDVVHYNPIHLFREKFPKYFDPKTLTGASDHFPLYLRLKE